MSTPQDPGFPQSHGERAALAQELLELKLGCHPDPAALRARVAAGDIDPTLLAEVDDVAATLQRATRDEVSAPWRPDTSVVADLDQKPAPTRWPALIWRTPVGRLLTVAAIAVVVGLSFTGYRAWRQHEVDDFGATRLQLAVSGPRQLVAGTTSTFRVRTTDLFARPAAIPGEWRLTREGSVVASGTVADASDAAIEWTVGAEVPDALEVTVRRGERSEAQVMPLDGARGEPLLHITTDKPLYRPGDPVRVRALSLDRVSLQPVADAMPALHLELRDPSGAVVTQGNGNSVDDVNEVRAVQLRLPSEAAGGRWTLLAHLGDSSRAVRTPLHVQRTQAPRLRKQIDLDRDSYGPGERGTAWLSVSRHGGGEVAGAEVDGKVIIDGEEVWRGATTVDRSGQGILAFELPTDVAGSAGRLLVTVRDGSVIESAVRTFALPVSRVEVTAYPEGGDLVPSGRDKARVYFEVTDSGGRPVHATGDIVNSSGQVVAPFAVAHQGRGVGEFVVTAGERYALRLREPVASQHVLPDVVNDGVGLRVKTQANTDLAVTLHGETSVPMLVAAFCRGVLVGQAAVPAGGANTQLPFNLPINRDVVGVLRVTAFAQKSGHLIPVAERLVQRGLDPSRQITVAVAAARGTSAENPLGTAAQQEITVRANVANALLGVRVYDAALQDLTTDRSVGLLDNALLLADVKRPEDLDGLLLGSEHRLEHVDLFLGTRGWRRFRWHDDAGTGTPLNEDQRAVLARVTPNTATQVVESGRGARRELRLRRQAFSVASRWAETAWGLGICVLLVLAWIEAVRLAIKGTTSWRIVGGVAAALGVVGLCLLLTSVVGGKFEGLMNPSDSMASSEVGLVVDSTVLDSGLFDADDMESWDFQQELDFAAGSGLLTDRRLEDDSRAPAGDFEEHEARARRELRGQVVREYAHRAMVDPQADARRDHTECLYWNPLLVTDSSGVATFSFDTSDRLTSWVVHVDAHAAGAVGEGHGSFDTSQPLELDVALPLELSQGDRVLVPVGVTARTADAIAAGEVELRAAGTGALTVLEDNARFARTQVLTNGKGRVHVPVTVGPASEEPATLTVRARAGRRGDVFERPVRVVPRGFPVARGHGGALTESGTAAFAVNFPSDPVAGSARAVLRLYPSPLGMLQRGLEGMIRRPTGCFEQTSSSNFPNVLVLTLLERTGAGLRDSDGLDGALARATHLARSYLPEAYERLAGFESPSGGFEWFGGDPGHLALTAYGLKQFQAMGQVWPGVDGAMLARTREWILERRNGAGGFVPDVNHHLFGQASPDVVSAYVCWTLLASEPELAAQLDREVAARAERAQVTDDAYELALCAASLGAAGKNAARDGALARLLTMQERDGGFTGAERSITSSRGHNLRVETTALAVIALHGAARASSAPKSATALRRAISWLIEQQQGGGTFGATQATVLALEALLTVATPAQGEGPGETRVVVEIAGEVVADAAMSNDELAPVELELARHLLAGSNSISVRTEPSRGGMPWALEVSYFAEQPADDPGSGLTFALEIGQGLGPGTTTGSPGANTLREGDAVSLEVRVGNGSAAETLGMVTAVVGLPASLEVNQVILDDLRRGGAFDYVERHGRELHFYWRGMGPGAAAEFTLDLVARIPGETRGPASRAWVYYEPERVRWLKPLSISVQPAR